MLHADKLVRALAIEMEWPEFGVCIDCYAVLAEHQKIVRAEFAKEKDEVSK